MENYIIGFGGVMYTLWTIDKSRGIGYGGRPYTKTRYQYIKNISKDESVVREKYPDAPLDPTLQGKKWSFDRVAYDPLPNDVFAFGKYQGKQIMDCTDYDYLFWYYECGGLNDDQRCIVEEQLLNSGKYAKYNDRLMTIEDANIYFENESKAKEIISTIKEQKEIVVNSISSIFLNDSFTSKTDNGTILNWDMYMDGENIPMVDCYYNGFTYYLPSKKGKGKRIKGKTLKIYADNAELVFGQLAEIFVKDFEIIKV